MHELTPIVQSLRCKSQNPHDERSQLTSNHCFSGLDFKLCRLLHGELPMWEAILARLGVHTGVEGLVFQNIRVDFWQN